MFFRNHYTNRLFCQSTLLTGLGSVFNIVGNYYDFNYSSTPEDADQEALEADWEAVSDDIMEAIRTYTQKKNIHVDALPYARRCLNESIR